MRILLLNQTFAPDVMATGQYLSELAVYLAERGHQVTVVTSRRAYDHPEQRFPKREDWRGVRIYRVANTGFGKTAKWRRAVDFASFLVSCCLRLLVLPKQDAVVALTTPPLISFIGACLARLRGCRFYYWVMDFNPDEAVAAGWLRAGSLVERTLDRMSRFSLREAASVIALDRFMRDRILAKGIPSERVAVIPPWAHDDAVHFDRVGRERFRKAHGLDGKFVVMYSGNHSPVHPLDTLLDAARKLCEDREIVFCFIGGGSEWRKIQKAVTERPSDKTTGSDPSSHGHILCLPYQSLDQLSASLSAADLHVVVMGTAFVGLVHPCKIYNMLAVGTPILYIGPRPSHVTEVLDALGDRLFSRQAAHGAVDQVIQAIRESRQLTVKSRRAAAEPLSDGYAKGVLLPELAALLESAALPGRSD